MIATWPAGSMWAYHAVFTQSNAGGGNVLIQITPGAGTEVILQSVQIGPDDYAADRTGAIQLMDSEGTPNRVARLIPLAAIDNEVMMWPSINATADFTHLWPGQQIIMTGADQLRIYLNAFAQNETITVAIRARLRGQIPVITTTGSGGTVGVATTYSVVL